MHIYNVMLLSLFSHACGTKKKNHCFDDIQFATQPAIIVLVQSWVAFSGKFKKKKLKTTTSCLKKKLVFIVFKI